MHNPLDKFAHIPNPFYVGWMMVLPIGMSLLMMSLAFFMFIADNYSVEWPQPIGCKRVGSDKPSNLEDEHDPKHSGKDAKKTEKSIVKALFIWPIKSCIPVELETADIVRTGMKYDRQFTFAQKVTRRPEKQSDGSEKVTSQWKFITQRECPRLALVKAELWVPDPNNLSYNAEREVCKNGGCIIVSFPYTPDFTFSLTGLSHLFQNLGAKYRAWNWSAEQTLSFEIPFEPTAERMQKKEYEPMENVVIWNENPKAINMAKEIPKDVLEKLKYTLGMSNPLTLFRFDSAKYRQVFRCAPTQDEVGYQPVVGFADAYPLSIMGISSVQDVVSRLPEKNRAGPQAIRFHSNIYTIVTGSPPNAEDEWKRVRINGSEFHVVSRIVRCKLPNVDPVTCIADRNEPYSSMKKHRCIDEGAANMPCLGMSMVASTSEDREIRIGDQVEVLETGPHRYIMQ